MIVLFLLLLVIAGAVFWWRGRQRIEQQHGASQPASAERSVFNLEIGDIVQNDLRDWIVETIYQYNQDGFKWIEYLLRDGDDVVWLSVVEDDWLELSWMTPVPSEDVAVSMPLRDSILFDGVSYQRVDRGLARFRTIGRSRNQDGFCQFHDYKGPDQRCLSVEIYGTEFDQGDLELCVGERIQAQQLSLLPGDGRSVYSSSTRVESQ